MQFGTNITRTMSVQSAFEEHMSCFCVAISDESGGGDRHPHQKQGMCSLQIDRTPVCCCFYYILYIWYRFNRFL